MAEELSRVFELSRAMPPGPAPQLLRSELGIAPVQLPAPASLGLFDGLMRYKGVLVLAALGAFAAGAALLERHKPRLERPLASSVAPSPARGAPSLEAPSLEAPSLEAPPLEAVRESFSGLGRRVGPVPESAKATRSAPAAAVPPLALTLAPVVAPVAAAVPASAPAAAPASSIVTRTAPLRPAPAKASVERAGSAADAACEPPWFVDSRGIRRVKPRCL
jgi:hypothetical protein